MVVKECKQIHRVCIYQILSQIVIQSIKTACPICCFFIKCLVHVFHQWEIHNGLQVGVAWSGEFAVLLPERNKNIAVQPGFSYDVEIRIFVVHFLAPARHEIVVGIGVCVLTDAIDACVFNPPDTALNQETGYVG